MPDWEVAAVEPLASDWQPVGQQAKATPQKYEGDDIYRMVVDKANAYGVRPDIALSLAKQESGFSPSAVSPTGVKGLFQVTLGTGRMYKKDYNEADRRNPETSADLGLRYLADLYKEKGNWPDAIYAYNGGSDSNFRMNVGKHLPWARQQLSRISQVSRISQGPKQSGGWEVESVTPIGAPPEPVPTTAAPAPAMPRPTGQHAGLWDLEQQMRGQPGQSVADLTPQTSQQPLFDTAPIPEFTPRPAVTSQPVQPAPAIPAPMDNDYFRERQPGVPELPASVTYETGREAMPKKKLAAEGWTPAQMEDGRWTLVKGDKRTKETFDSPGAAKEYGFSPGQNVYSATLSAPTGTDLLKSLGKLPGRIKVRAGASDAEMGEMLRQGLPYAHQEREYEAALLERLDKAGLNDRHAAMRIAAPSSFAMKNFEAGLLPYDKLSPADKQAIIAKYADKSLLQGIQRGFTMGSTGREAPMPGTERIAQAGELIGSLVPIGAALNTGKFAVKAFFPLVAETLAGRVGAAGVGGLAFGAGREAISSAAAGKPADMETVAKIGESGAQDALLFMGLHFGGETAAAYLANKIPLAQTAWEKASSDLKDFYNRKFGKQALDFPATVSKEEILTRLSKMDEDSRTELLWGIKDPDISLKPGMGQGSSALREVWREAVVTARKEAGLTKNYGPGFTESVVEEKMKAGEALAAHEITEHPDLAKKYGYDRPPEEPPAAAAPAPAPEPQGPTPGAPGWEVESVTPIETQPTPEPREAPVAPGAATSDIGVPPAPTIPAGKVAPVFQDPDGWWRIRGLEDSEAHKFSTQPEAEKVAGRVGVQPDKTVSKEDLHSRYGIDEKTPGVYWHGTPSGDLRGSSYGLHVGTFDAAKQALNAKIGHPAVGEWDGTREYGKTLLAGSKRLKEIGDHATGYSAGGPGIKLPEENFYPGDWKEGKADYPDKSRVSLTAKPDIFPVRIKGEMTNLPSRPHEDFKANALMTGQIKRGTAKRGYYYKNVGEDEGSISAVLPNAKHIEKIEPVTAKPAPAPAKGKEAVSSTQIPDRNAAAVKPTADSTTRDIEHLSNIAQSSTFRDKGFNGLDIPSQRDVLRSMLAALHQPEIREAVIKTVPVDVVDKLVAIEPSANMGLHDKGVLKELLAVNPDGTVSLRTDTGESLVRSITRFIAEHEGRPLDSIRNARQESPAVGARGEVGSSHVDTPALIRTEKQTGLVLPDKSRLPENLFPADLTRDIRNGIDIGHIKTSADVLDRIAQLTGKSKPEVLKDYPDLAKPDLKPAEKGAGIKPSRLRTKPAPTTPEEFSQQQGTAKGAKPEGLLTRNPKRHSIGKQIEYGNRGAAVRSYGGIRSDSRAFQELQPEEKKYLILRGFVRNKTGFGADVLLQALKHDFPGEFNTYETDDQFVRDMLDPRFNQTQTDPDQIERETRAYYEREQESIERDAEALGVTPEALAEIEAEAVREATEYERLERDAIRSEGTETWEKELDELLPRSKVPFFLTPPVPKTPKLTKRLDALQADYPGLNRERAAVVIRALPQAEDGQIVNMSEDPEMFNRVARGNLAASEVQQLLKKSSDAGQQMALPGLTPPGRLFSLAPTFYSQMAVSLEAKLPGKSSGPQLADLIEGWVKKGDPKFPIKADELKWSGVIPFLREQQGPVTKQQIADFLKENQVEVREVRKGKVGFPKPPTFDEWLEKKGHAPPGSVDKHLQYQKEIDKYWADSPMPTKFGAYMKLPPGGENYREVLLTVPEAGANKALEEFDARRAVFESLHKDAADTLQTVGVSREEAYKILRGIANEDTQATWLKVAKNHLPRYDWQPYIDSFKESEALSRKELELRNREFDVPSPHAYGDPAADVNRFAHMFMDDRVIDGKKYLTIWEMQSDWAQEGRRKGYKGKPLTELPEGYKVRKGGGVNDEWFVSTPDGRDIAASRSTKQKAIDQALTYLNNQGVPPFPFSKNWMEVALKKMLRMAAEEGYSGIAWATGSMVKERYDLSKQVDAIHAKKNNDGTWDLKAVTNAGVVDQPDMKGVSSEKLSDVIGKDLAEKIIAESGTVMTAHGMENVWPRIPGALKKIENYRVYSGNDLKIGGSWADRQYDQMMPQFLGKYGKQWGARPEIGEIGKTEIMQVIRAGPGDWRVLDMDRRSLRKPNGGPLSFSSEKEATVYSESHPLIEKIHTLPFTSALKDSVLTKGQPLYKLPEEGEPNVPGQRESAADSLTEPQDRSERLAGASERLGRELEGFRSRRNQEFTEGRLPPGDAQLWKEVEYNPALLKSPEFQAITAAAKAIGISEVLPIKSDKICGCIHPEDDGRQIMLLSDTHLGTNSLTSIAGHETFHYRLGSKDWPAVRLFLVIDHNSPTFKKYANYLNSRHKEMGFAPLSIAQVKDEIGANLAGGITYPSLKIDFEKAVRPGINLKKILEDYHTQEMAHQQAADGDLISKFFIDAPKGKTEPPLTPQEEREGGVVLSTGINRAQFKIAKRGLDHLLQGVFNKFNDWGIRPPTAAGRRAMDKYIPSELQRQGIVNWLRFAYFPEHVARTRPAFTPMRDADIAAGDKSAELRDEIWGRMQTYFKELNPQSRAKVDALLLRLDKIQDLTARKRLEEKVQEKGADYFKGFKGHPLNDLEAKAVYGIWDAMNFVRKDLTQSMLEHLTDYGESRGLPADEARRFAGEVALNLDKPIEQVISEYLPEIKEGTKTAKGEPATEEVVIGGQKYWASEAQAADIAKKVGIEPIRIEKQAKGYVIIGPAEAGGGAKAERTVSGIEKTLQKQRDTIQFWLRDRAFYLLPHTRWGPFWVRVYDSEGKMAWAGARETTAAAKQMLEDAKKEFGEGFKYRMTREDKKPMELYNNVNMPAVSAIMELAKDKLPADNRRELMEAWQTFWASKGWGAHLIHRSNIPGFENENLRRVFSDYIEGYIGMRSKMTRANGFTKGWEGFADREGGNDPALQRYTLEYTRYLLDHPYEYSWIRRVLYHVYLGGSMGFRLLHGLHAVQTAWPVLSTVTKGAGRILSKAYTDRYGLTLENLGAIEKAPGITDREREALKIGRRHEGLSETYAQEIAAKGQSPFGRWLYNDPTGPKAKALDIWKNIYYPGESDKWLREGMFLASLRAVDPRFSQKDKVDQASIDKALKLTQEAFFRYARGDRPPIGRGLGSVWFTFQTWSTKYFQLIHRMATEGHYGGLGRMLLAAIAVGGLTGAGILGIVKRIYRRQTGRNAEADIKDYMQGMFGETVGNITARTLMHGLPAGLFGFDLSQRMVHHLPMVEENDRPGDWSKKLIGAVGGPFEKLGYAARNLEEGDLSRTAESLAPSFIANPIRASRMYREGQTSTTGRPIMGSELEQERLTGPEAVMKGLGVQPIRLTEEEANAKFLRLMEQDQKARKQKFVSRLDNLLRAQEAAENRGDQKAADRFSARYDATIDELDKYNQKMLDAGRDADVITNKEINAGIKSRHKPIYQDPRGAKKQMQRKGAERF